MMRNSVLALLARTPAHGYELKLAIDEAFGGVWPPVNVGQIYTTLSRLERDGLVRSAHVAQANKPDKRVYELTERGREELREWLYEPVVEPWLKDEFFTKLVMAHITGVNGEHAPIRLIDRQRRSYLQLLRDLHDLGARLEAEHNVIGSLLLEGSILHVQADLEWLQLCEQRFTEGDVR
jgi:DNA-binding PadR family transcriptional regulator